MKLIDMKLKNFLKINKIPLLLSITIFIVGFMVGIITINLDQNPHTEKPLIKDTIPLDISVLSLVKNNGTIELLLISGSFCFGLTTFFMLLYNAIIFGIEIACSMKNASLITIMLLILPHSIFELPSVWLAGAAGFYIPYEIIRYFTDKKEYILNKDEVFNFVSLILIAFILLFIAAIVESSVTMQIGKITI